MYGSVHKIPSYVCVVMYGLFHKIPSDGCVMLCYVRVVPARLFFMQTLETLETWVGILAESVNKIIICKNI